MWCKEEKKKKTAHHSLAYPDRGDIRKLLMFSLALSPIIALSFYSHVLKCKSSSPAAWQVMFLALISISQVKGQDDIFCPAVMTVTYMLPVQDGTLLRGPPSLSSKLIMNQSVWNIYGCPPTQPDVHTHTHTPFLPSLLPWGQLEHPWWPLLSESGKPLALSYQYSSVDLQLRRVRLLFPHIANLHSPACVGDGMLAASPPCSQTYCCLPLSVFFYFFFFFFSERERFLDSWHAREGSSEDYIG